MGPPPSDDLSSFRFRYVEVDLVFDWHFEIIHQPVKIELIVSKTMVAQASR